MELTRCDRIVSDLTEFDRVDWACSLFVEMAQRGRGRREIRGKGHNRNFGGELELYLQFGRNNDDNLNQKNEIKELSRQIATLIEEMEHLQPSIKGRDGSKDA